MQFKVKHLIIAIIVILVVVVGAMSWHQHSHFNRNTTVNGVAVGGMTVDQAYQKVKATSRANDVYLNGKLIYNGEATGSGISSADKSKFQAAQKEQRTFFPSGKKQNVTVTPSNVDNDQTAAMKQAVNAEAAKLNAGRRAPVDAYAVLKNGKVSTVSAKKGNQYDIKNLMKQFNDERANGTIRLTAHYTQPLTSDSKVVQDEKSKLQTLAKRKVTYQVEKQNYKFNANEVITKATYQNGKYAFDTSAVNNEIAKINKKQATLGRSFKFKTHSGKEITTNNKGSYGWKISDQRAGQSLANAMAQNKKTIDAKNDIYGIGYNKRGTGYGVTSNDGIGNTYVELSLADQHVWFYKDGKCVFDADVVTGSNTPGNRTPKGVWYIMYQQSPATLRGLNDDGSKYSSPVQYWSPFTDTGCGFHDASWRNNWSKTEYLTTTGGSHGCANMHPSDAGTAYHDMEINEPVVIY
ncbi:L,D-transpeptidase family protein [Limosilactobacillus viscerum]|uniref:L,D-transpeptidase family protein n=1 Tax=Limosilactobacillus viscerum TaxID=2993450 RepID=UPI0024B8F7E6|nr:L,D-transpeptidase family protein [Limosilactobacillus viscerum]